MIEEDPCARNARILLADPRAGWQHRGVPPRRRTDPAEGTAALRAWAAAPDPGAVPRPTVATAVRWSLEELAARAPGHATEVRVPPFGVTQCMEGPRHTRGTPPNTVEADAGTWLALVTGRLAWDDAVAAGRVRASGERADLRSLLPLAPGLSGASAGPGPATVEA